MRRGNAESVSMLIDGSSEVPRYQQLANAIRDAIVSGSLPEGSRLASVRQQAQDLGVSRATVERAYLQLEVEGFIQSVPRSGYVVRYVDTDFLKRSGLVLKGALADAPAPLGLPDTPAAVRKMMEEIAPKSERYDFSYVNLAPGSFPAKERLRSEKAILAEDQGLASRYPSRIRPGELQVQLARMLAATRGFHCNPAQVAVFPSTDFALQVIAMCFDPASDVFGVEEPGYPDLVDIARRLGFSVVPLASDQGPDRFREDIEAQKPRVVFVTPSHQLPTGTVMPFEQRVELLKWAHDRDAYIIEDDSCNEYRYDVDPIPSLSSIDSDGRVIYLGNFSKTFSPALRMAYAVIPAMLYGAYLDSFAATRTAVSEIDQLVLADLIARGVYRQYVQRIVRSTRMRHDRLLACLECEMGGRLEISGMQAGMHLYVGVDNGMTQDELVESARRQSVRVYRSDILWFSGRKPADKVLIGFSSIDLEDIPEGVRRLRAAWFPDC